MIEDKLPTEFRTVPAEFRTNDKMEKTILSCKEAFVKMHSSFNQEKLQIPLFLVAVPNSGVHLLANIISIFVPNKQQEFQIFNSKSGKASNIIFEKLSNGVCDKPYGGNYFLWGHLPYTNDTVKLLSKYNKVVLVRDPYSWVISQYKKTLRYIDTEDSFFTQLNANTIISMILDKYFTFKPYANIHGYPIENIDINYFNYGIRWFHEGYYLVRFEDLLEHLEILKDPDKDDSIAYEYFKELLLQCGIAITQDWKERILLASDPKFSPTYDDGSPPKYMSDKTIPKELADVHKKAVNIILPSARELFGYTI